MQWYCLTTAARQAEIAQCCMYKDSVAGVEAHGSSQILPHHHLLHDQLRTSS
eukprot:gene1330-4512_t